LRGSLSRTAHPRRHHTLDKLDAGTETERYWELATGSNEKTRLKYAWHLVRNHSEQEASSSNDEHDSTEAAFLSSGRWAAIPEEDKGIKALRSKLSSMLSVHIAKRLPGVVEDMKRSRFGSTALTSSRTFCWLMLGRAPTTARIMVLLD